MLVGVSYTESEKKRKEKRVSELVGVLVGWIDLAFLVYLLDQCEYPVVR